ncbi:MAG: ParB/RepB/Spo0J family partition protein [Bacteroidota bacterium]
MSNNQKKSGLGRGLSALLEDSDTDVTSRSSTPASVTGVVGSVTELSLDQIEPNPFQPRTEFTADQLKELAQSISEQGIIQPITVRKMGYDKYQIISGERRFRASKLSGAKTIPAYIRIANDQAMLEMALVENIQRQDLNPIDIGISYKRLIDECSITQDELSERVGKNRTTISNFIRLLKLPPDIQLALRDNKISMGHAKALMGIDDLSNQLLLFKEILEKNLNVRDVESLVSKGGGKSRRGGKKSGSPGSSNLSFEYNKIRNVLTSHFGSQVQLQVAKDGSGRISIPFNDNQDLNRILELLNY